MNISEYLNGTINSDSSKASTKEYVKHNYFPDSHNSTRKAITCNRFCCRPYLPSFLNIAPFDLNNDVHVMLRRKFIHRKYFNCQSAVVGIMYTPP